MVQEIIEACVVGIFPMKLLVRALQKAPFAERAPFLFGQERDVCGREIARSGYFDERVRERSTDRVSYRARGRKQARPGHRRKWNRDLEFWIVVAPGALKGLRPAMVENVFAAGVAFCIAGRRTQRPSVHAFREQVPRLPARSRADRIRLLKRRQKLVRYKRVISLPSCR